MSTTLARAQEVAPLEEGSRTDTHRTGVRTYQELSISAATPILLATVAGAGYQFSISWTTTSAIPTSARHLSAGGLLLHGGDSGGGRGTIPSAREWATPPLGAATSDR